MIDKSSETWLEVATWALTRLSSATDRIEMIGVEAAETENLRGRIRELRELLAMVDEVEPRVLEPTQDYGLQGFDEG